MFESETKCFIVFKTLICSFLFLFFIIIFFLFVGICKVDAAQTITFELSQYLRNNQNSVNAYNIGTVINECYNATECDIPTSNLFLQNGFSANWYVGDSSISSEDNLILSGNSYTINFSYSIFNNSSTKDNFIPSLAIYNSSTSKWVLATCDVGESYSSTKYYQENDVTTYRQDFVYKCEKLNSTISGPTFRTALVLSDQSNLSGSGNWTSNLTLIDLNRDSGINDVINNQNQNTDKIIGAIDDIWSNGSVETNPVDGSLWEEYNQFEKDLLMEDFDAFDELNTSFDSTSSNFIWQLVTGFLQSHSLVFTFFITILSFGVVKLVLNR